ncbi:MAG: hypothetical protein ACLR8P_19715 [Clostridium fessum]
MLTNMYGDFMQLPPVEKRKTHTEPAGIFEGRDTVVIKYLANALIGGDGQIEKRNMSCNMIGSFLYALASMVLTIAVIQIVGEDEGGILLLCVFYTLVSICLWWPIFGIPPVPDHGYEAAVYVW